MCFRVIDNYFLWKVFISYVFCRAFGSITQDIRASGSLAKDIFYEELKNFKVITLKS